MFDLTPLLRIYARVRMSRLDGYSPADIQFSTLKRLLHSASNTRIGRDYQFSTIRSVQEYQRRVPLRTYDDFWRDYWSRDFPVLNDVTWPGRIPFFAVSSGTSTGITKYIPLSHEMNASNTKAGLDLLTFHAHNVPQSRFLGGRSFFLGGSTDLVERAPGIFSGDLSGIAVKMLPWWARPRYFPDASLALLKNWEEKIEILARRSLVSNIRTISGVPSWMLIFFDKIRELVPESAEDIRHAFPHLEMIVHGGVNFTPYRDRFSQLLAGTRVELREVYPASEGFIAIADRHSGEGLRMLLDHGNFFEFVPAEELSNPNPTRHWIGNVQKDVNYAIVLTTCAGLWSYVIGDTVRFVDTEKPRLLVTGRTSYYLSAFGEHLIGEEIEDAVATAAHEQRVTVTDFSVGAVFPRSERELGGHLYVVELDSTAHPEFSAAQFSEAIDKKLCERNEDYEAHRAQGYGLKAPQIVTVQSGTFAQWMKSRGKLGGQNKVPRIITDQTLFDSLQEFAAERTC